MTSPGRAMQLAALEVPSGRQILLMKTSVARLGPLPCKDEGKNLSVTRIKKSKRGRSKVEFVPASNRLFLTRRDPRLRNQLGASSPTFNHSGLKPIVLEIRVIEDNNLHIRSQFGCHISDQPVE